nr:unnamed protein product [Spirometra erinaceieuropaei]
MPAVPVAHITSLVFKDDEEDDESDVKNLKTTSTTRRAPKPTTRSPKQIAQMNLTTTTAKPTGGNTGGTTSTSPRIITIALSSVTVFCLVGMLWA